MPKPVIESFHDLDKVCESVEDFKTIVGMIGSASERVCDDTEMHQLHHLRETLSFCLLELLFRCKRLHRISHYHTSELAKRLSVHIVCNSLDAVYAKHRRSQKGDQQ